MKKFLVFSFTVILFTVFSVNTFALADTKPLRFNETLSIRGGIHFLASKETVQHVEEKNNSEVHTEWDAWGYPRMFDLKITDLRYKTNLAGHEVLLFYYFNDNEELVEYHYFLTESSYDDITDLLIDKYGSPQFERLTSSPFSSRAFA